MHKYFYLLIILVFFTGSHALRAQEIAIVDYASFEARIGQKSDTLFVYNFWATWCKPCVEELPHFEALNQNYSDKKVKVVLVSLDFPNHYDTQLVPFVKKKALQSEVILLDAPNYNDWIGKIGQNWSGALPGTLLKMPVNDIHEFWEQSFSYEELATAVDNILGRIH